VIHSPLPAIVAILFVATLIRSAFGFGEALISVPLLALIIPVSVAAPVAALVSITVAAVVVAQDHAEIHARSAVRLVVATLFGVPLGLWMLTAVAEPVVKGILAVVIIAFSGYSLASAFIRSRPLALADDRHAWMFGLGAGVLGGAYGMNGPPLVVYGTMRGWTPTQFRATLQGYFLPASIAVMIGYWAAGLWSADVTRYYLLSLPGIALAIVVGRAINRRLEARVFLLCVHAGLITIGAVLLAQAVGR
jgi:uncharacterized membrane protein YfcA